jgi:Ras-related protein Rab-4B
MGGRTQYVVLTVIYGPTGCLIINFLTDVHFLETSSLTGDNVEAPFLLAARSILLSIESGTLDPEKAGSGVSYGDRALQRVNSSSRLSFGSLNSGRRRGGGKFKLRDWIPGTGRRCC